MEQSIIKKTVHNLKGRSIFLIGMMGSGKSKTGLKLAELLKYKYIDLDSLIEKLQKNLSIKFLMMKEKIISVN